MGVGTKLVTAFDQPALGGVYKLSAIKDGEKPWKYKVKISEQAIKISNPGIQQVRRFMDDDGYVGDMIFNVENKLPTECIIVDPLDMTRRKRIAAESKFHDLLVPVFLNGRKVYDVPSVQVTRNYVREQLQNFHPTLQTNYESSSIPGRARDRFARTQNGIDLARKRASANSQRCFRKKTAKTKKPNAGLVAESVSEKKQNLSAKRSNACFANT